MESPILNRNPNQALPTSKGRNKFQPRKLNLLKYAEEIGFRVLPYMITALAVLIMVEPMMRGGLIVFSDLAFAQSSEFFMAQIFGLWNRHWSSPNFFNVPRLIYTLPFYIGSVFLGFDGAFLQKWFIIGILILSAVSFHRFTYALVKIFIPEYRKSLYIYFLLILASLYYAVNPWTIVRIQHIYLLCGYSMMPLVFYYYLNIFSVRFERLHLGYEVDNRVHLKFTTLLDILMFSFLFTLNVAALHYFFFELIIIGIMHGMIIIRYLLKYWRKPIRFLTYIVNHIQRLIVLGILCGLFTMYWLSPYVGTILLNVTPDQGNINTPETIVMFSRHSSLINVMYAANYWWPMFDLNSLPISFYVGGGVCLLFAVFGFLAGNWYFKMVGGIAAGLTLFGTGTFYPWFAEVYLALVFKSFFPINNIVRDPNKLTGVALFFIALLIFRGGHFLVSAGNSGKAARTIRGTLVIVLLSICYAWWIYPYYEVFFDVYYRPPEVPAEYDYLNAYLTENAEPGDRVYHMPGAEHMLNTQTHISTPFWNREIRDGQIIERSTADFAVYETRIYTRFQHEGNVVTIRQYFDYLQHLIDQGKTNNLAQLLVPISTEYMAYREEYPHLQHIQDINLDVINIQPELNQVYQDDIFTLYKTDDFNTADRALHYLVYTPHGFDTFERYASHEHFDFSEGGVMLLSSALGEDWFAHLRPEDYIDLKEETEFILTTLDRDRVLAVSDQSLEAHPFLKWSKSFVGTSDWNWHLRKNRVTQNAHDFDFARGITFANAHGRVDAKPYMIDKVEGELIFDLGDQPLDYFISGHEEFLALDPDPGALPAYQQSIDAELENGPNHYIWKVAQAGVMPAKPAHPYRISGVLSGQNADNTHIKVKLYDTYLNELDIVYLSRSNLRPDFTEEYMQNEFVTPVNTAMMEITVLAQQKPNRPTHWTLHSLQIEDLGEYASENTLFLKYNIPQNESYEIYLRTFVSTAGGILRVDVDDQPVEVWTGTDTVNRFEWLKVGEFNLTAGEIDINVTNVSGFNGLNAFAIVPKSEMEASRAALAEKFKDNNIFMTFEPEEEFDYTGHLQSDTNYPIYTTGDALRSNDGTAYRNFDIVVPGSYQLDVNHSAIPENGWVDILLTERDTNEVVYQARLDETQGPLDEEMIKAVHHNRLSHYYMVDEKDVLLANRQFTELPDIDLEPGAYILELNYNSNATPLATTEDIAPLSYQDNITSTYNAETDILTSEYFYRETPSDESISETILPCTEEELIETGALDEALARQQPLSYNKPDRWQILGLQWMEVNEYTTYVYEYEVNEFLLDDLHTKVQFYDEDREPICIEYIINPNDRFRDIRFSDQVLEHFYTPRYGDLYDNEQSIWTPYEFTINAPVNAKYMSYLIVTKIEDPERALGGEVSTLQVRDFSIYGFDTMIAVDMLTLHKTNQGQPIFEPTNEVPIIQTETVNTMTTDFQIIHSEETVDETVMLYFQESPSKIWKINLFEEDQITGIFVNGLSNVFPVPAEQTEGRIKIALADFYYAGIFLLIVGTVVSGFIFFGARIKIIHIHWSNHSEDNDMKEKSDNPTIFRQIKLWEWIKAHQHYIYPVLDIPLSGINYFYLVFASWFLTREDYGISNSLMALLGLFLIISVGVQTYTAKLISSGEEPPTDKDIFLFSTFVLAGFSVLYLAMTPVFMIVTHGSLVSILLILAIFACNLYVSIFRGIYQGKNHFIFLNISFYVENVVKIILLVMLMPVLKSMDLLFVTIWPGMGLSLLISILWQFDRGLVRPKLRNLKNRRISSGVRTVAQGVTAIIVGQVFLQYFMSIDIIILNYYSPSDSGIYAVVMKYGQLIFFSFMSIQTVIFPYLNRAAVSLKKLYRMVNRIILVMFLVAIPTIVIYWLVLPFSLPYMFGDEYLAAGPYLALGSGSALLLVLINFLVSLYIVQGNNSYIRQLAIAAGLLTVGYIFASSRIEYVIFMQLGVYTFLSLSLWIGFRRKFPANVLESRRARPVRASL